ncbi:MAG: hypothetical protein QOJ63_321 [Solirubrobacteraceae bacterium]|jgi:hypothetical protein|nr:hypothetical protein [Solirubrobacteraceae bacterium]
MAVYAGSPRRRQTTAAIAVVALVVGVLIGVPIGRGTAESLDDQIAAGRDGGRELVTALRVLPLEYAQAYEGSSETGLIEDTVRRSTAGLPSALQGAPWLGPAQRDTANAAVRAVEAAAHGRVAPRRFETIVARSTALLQSVFGLPVSTSG